MTQEELTRLGIIAVQELDLDFHLESASQRESRLFFIYSNRHADPEHRTFEAQVDMDRVGRTEETVKGALRREIEFAGHPFGRH
ncbi:MAG TPA: hypothetical protein VIC33_01925 [Vicinamibacterales bacterium]|jgi:hypothetical protein